MNANKREPYKIQKIETGFPFYQANIHLKTK